MYTERNRRYADPYRLLRADGMVCFECAADAAVDEIEAPTDDITLAEGVAVWGGGLCAMRVGDGEGYASLKTRLVRLRYSYDDQIAVMLNGDEEKMRRMQAWREWAADVAHKIERLQEEQSQSPLAQSPLAP